MKTTYIFFILIFFILSCLYSQNKTVIKGKIINNKDIKEIYFEKLFPEKILDTIEVKKSGKFKIVTYISLSDFYKIRFTEKDYIFYIPIPGEQAKIEIKTNNLRKPKISGSKHTELIYSLIENNQKLDKILEAQKIANQKQKKNLLRNMIKENPNSLACLIFLEDLDINTDSDYYKILNDNLPEYPDNTLVNQFRQNYNKNSILKIGTEAPDISLNNPLGNEIKLSFLKGKYVLIDFWASWCRPCRIENPGLVNLYKKYNRQGFEIYSISLDENQENWLKAIETDKTGEWIHVRDLQGRKSVSKNLYKIISIPFTLLLDKEGKIISKELRGIELENKLKEIFKK